MPKRKLTKTQKKIVAKIKRLYKDNEPLNITAVKRNHPELIKQVYAVKPFWGWKCALEAAGIDYSGIITELEVYCQCKICGDYKSNLTQHLLLSHHVSTEDYLIDYPDADLVSDELKARRAMRKAFLPHWERIWTPEYALDRMMEYCCKGYHPGYTWIKEHDPSLLNHVYYYFGNWGEGLKIIGLNANHIRRESFRRQRQYPDQKSVIKEIIRRKKKKLPISNTGVMKGSHRNGALHQSGVSYFGNWGEALQVAGFNSEAIVKKNWQQKRKYPDEKSVIRQIRWRRKNNLPVNLGAVQEGPYADPLLAKYGVQYFGNWDPALQAAGLDPKVIRKEVFQARRLYNTPKKVIKEIRRRHRKGLTLINGILRKSDPTLVARGKEHFDGSWANAVKSASYDYQKLLAANTMKRWRYQNKTSVKKEIGRRRKRKQPLNISGLLSGKSLDTALLNSARYFYGSWAKALLAAGINPKSVRLNS